MEDWLLGAYRFIAESVPGENNALANDSFCYLLAWLSAQVSILKSFADVGLGSGAYLGKPAAQLAAEKGLEVVSVSAPDGLARGVVRPGEKGP